jgi:predicted glutamine amidotransferase
MCGIAAAPSLKKAYSLYKDNLKRGYFSSGFLAIDSRNNIFVAKQKEVFDFDKLQKEMYQNLTEPLYCLFHSRAPTNSTKPFSEDTTHPFSFGTYYVAHNGIITNFKSFPESAEFDVDSSIIPFHLTQSGGDYIGVYERYEGLLTSWVYDLDEQSIFVIKAGSSLHMDKDSFSSVSFEGSESVDRDGVIYQYLGNKFIEMETFNYDNPYEL